MPAILARRIVRTVFKAVVRGNRTVVRIPPSPPYNIYLFDEIRTIGAHNLASEARFMLPGFGQGLKDWRVGHANQWPSRRLSDTTEEIPDISVRKRTEIFTLFSS